MLPTLKIVSYLSLADWLVFIAVLGLTVAAALYGSYCFKKTTYANSPLGYLLMGRKLTLPLFVATLVATWYGGIFGVNEITFNYGIYNFVTQGVFWYAAYLIFAFFVAKKVIQYHSVTLPDLTRRLFGEKSSRIAAWFTFFYMVPVAYVLSLGIFLHMVFGITLLNGMIAGTLFAGLYTVWGGFRSVVFADIVQFVVMCVAVLLVVIFSVSAFGGFTFLKAHIPPSHFTLTGGNSWLNTFVWGFIAFSTLIDPSFYQRCFAADNIHTIKKGILISTVIWFLFDICTTLGTLYARAVLPSAQPAEAYFFYAVQLLPSGLRGLFVAGILAIILSTLNSFLFIASNTLSFDLLKQRTSAKAVYFNRLAFIPVGILAILMAYVFHGSFKEIWLVLGSYFSACLLVPILMGYIFPNQISDRLFACTVLISAIVMTLWHWWPHGPHTAAIDPFYIGVLSSLAILICFGRGGNHVARVNRR